MTSVPSPAGSTVRASLRRPLVGLLIAFLIAAWAHVWCAGQGSPAASSRVRQYTERLASGHLSLADHDSPGFDTFDTSLYQGRYYLYFGITPFATVLVPWYRLSGHVFPDAWLTAGYSIGGFAAFGSALLLLLRRRNVTSPGGWSAWGLLAIAFGGGTLVLCRRPLIYELESAATVFHVGIALAALAAGVRDNRIRPGWIALGAASLGLAVGCRAPTVLAVPLFLATCAWACRRADARTRWRSALAALLPLAVIGAGLAWFNWARFGRIGEFGFTYQLTMIDRVRYPVFASENVLYNLHRYLLGGARIGDYFPFLLGERSSPVPVPPGHGESDQLYGVLWSVPALVVLGALGVWSAATRRSAPWLAIAGLALAALSQFVVLLAMGGSAYRYLTDFVPLALCAALLAAAPVLAERRLWLTAAVILSVAATCLFGFFQSCALYGILENQFPDSFARVGAWFNRPIYLAQRITGRVPQVPAAIVTFPAKPAATLEPLLVYGDAGLQDFVYIYYQSPEIIQLGFESIGRGGTLSGPIRIEPGRPYSLAIYAGSLLPPVGHPAYGVLPAAEAALLRRSIVVTLDGKPVLEASASFHRPRNQVSWGRSLNDTAFGSRFSGELDWSSPAPFTLQPYSARFDARNYGPWQTELTRANLPGGTTEPLLAAGLRNQGVLVSLQHLSPAQVRFGVHVWTPAGLKETWSEPVALPGGASAPLRIEGGPLLPPLASSLWMGWPPSERAARKQRLSVVLGGRTILECAVPEIDAAPSTVVLGSNTLSVSGVAPAIISGAATPVRGAWSSR